MFRKTMRFLTREHGQSVTEFAMIIPIVLIIFMGIFDFGWVLHKQMALDNAARAASRRGAVGVQTPLLIQRVKDTLYFPIMDNQIKVSVLDNQHNDIGDNNNRTQDNYIVVEITLTDVQLITPLRNMVGTMGSFNLTSRAEFLIE